jgi:hypothetical protein
VQEPPSVPQSVLENLKAAVLAESRQSSDLVELNGLITLER